MKNWNKIGTKRKKKQAETQINKLKWCAGCLYHAGAGWCDYWSMTGHLRSEICEAGEDCHRKGVYKRA